MPAASRLAKKCLACRSVESCTRRLRRSVTILLFRRRLLLLSPATKLHISPNHHLQSGVDDMIGRTLDKGGTLLDGERDRFLQFVFAFHHFGRLVNDRHGFSFPSLLDAGNTYKDRVFPSSLGWSDPHGFRGNESGVAPGQPGVFPASKLNVASGATSVLQNTSRHPGGDANGAGKGYAYLSRTRHRADKCLQGVSRAGSPETCRRILGGLAGAVRIPSAAPAPRCSPPRSTLGWQE